MMATVESSVKRVEVQGDVTLTLSPLEAIFLRSLLSETTGSASDSNDPESLSSSIHNALENAGVPTSEEDITMDGSIAFEFDAMNNMREAMKLWD